MSYFARAAVGAATIGVLAACQDPAAPVASGARAYLVRLRDGVSDSAAIGSLSEEHAATARALSAGRFHGLVATLSTDERRALEASGAVAGMELDAEVRGAGVQLDATWGLDRIDQTALPLGATYVYPGTGDGVTVYVLDTGIDPAHDEFGGRAAIGADFVSAGGQDCNGHGTHVAGVVGGATYGVAKRVRLVGVRVLDCSLRGTLSQVVSALGWVAQQKRADPRTPAVVNLSLESASSSTALEQAVAGALEAGVTVVAAAGNGGGDACAVSPARITGVLTVAATDRGDALADFSGRGTCVALAAPGVDVPSAWIGDPRAVRLMSGTSSASPFVAGAAALYLAAHPAAMPAEVRAALVGHATSGALARVPAGTPNRLLSVSFLRGDDDRMLPGSVQGPRVERRTGEETPGR